MEKPFVEAIDSKGICIVSAPKSEGLTTTWQGMLLSADRLTKDCIGLVTKENEEETSIENIVLKHYVSGEQKKIVDQTLLTRPDSIACSDIESPEVTDTLAASVLSQDVAVEPVCRKCSLRHEPAIGTATLSSLQTGNPGTAQTDPATWWRSTQANNDLSGVSSAATGTAS